MVILWDSFVLSWLSSWNIRDLKRAREKNQISPAYCSHSKRHNTPNRHVMSHYVTKMWHYVTKIWHYMTRMWYDITKMWHIVTKMSHSVTKKCDIMSQKNVPPMNLPFCWYVFVLIAWFDIYYFFIELGELFYIVVSLEKKKKNLLHFY